MMTMAQQSIVRQRDALGIFLQAPLTELAAVCAHIWPDRGALEDALRAGLATLPYCDHLFIMNLEGVQVTAQIGASSDDSQYWRWVSLCSPRPAVTTASTSVWTGHSDRI